jgi:cell fate regulator YaaT (PSP1 superfamily)
VRGIQTWRQSVLADIVGIRFKKAGKILFYSPGTYELAVGEPVLAETARGLELGHIAIVKRSESDTTLREILRRAEQGDMEQHENNKLKEKEAFQICLQKISAHSLPMKLVSVEYMFDGSKITFSFTADGRVDFRELVRDLASVFHTRIELRQIGVRDEAKAIGGMGCCGRELCCATFLGEFEPVSIRMAKDQNLSLNPAKISGICGRLMCCLKYENSCYENRQREQSPLAALEIPVDPEELRRLLDESEG